MHYKGAPDSEERKFWIWAEKYNWQIRNQDKMKKQLLINHLKKQNFDYIVKKRREQIKYRKTLISGVMFMILFTINIIFLWNCTPNEQEVFTYDYDLSAPITDTECEEYYGNRCRRLEQTYYLTMHRGLYRDKDIERLINENE